MPAASDLQQQLPLFDPVSINGSPPSLEVRGSDYDYLRSQSPPKLRKGRALIRVVDLFSGCGGLSLGILEACADLGLDFEAALAADFDEGALGCYTDNIPTALSSSKSVVTLIDGRLGDQPSDAEKKLVESVGDVTFLLGGPPCQGHSDLNNSTRRNDPKNALYLTMARAAEIFRPEHVIIENVVGARHDKNRVVQVTRNHLESLGYSTSLGIVDFVSIGVPQKRRRLILWASLSRPFALNTIVNVDPAPQRGIAWAIRDLIDVRSDSLLDTPSSPSADNVERIQHLLDNDLYDLPDALRPPCHRNKKHTYRSIYGRLHWDQPSQTITSGFYSTCMGRYVHPSRPRTLTAHEAARLQFFPDWFDFTSAGSRTSLARIIGNAVPMKLSYSIAHEVLDT